MLLPVTVLCPATGCCGTDGNQTNSGEAANVNGDVNLWDSQVAMRTNPPVRETGQTQLALLREVPSGAARHQADCAKRPVRAAHDFSERCALGG